MAIEFEIPITTQSETNLRENPFVRAKRVKTQRQTSAIFCRQWSEVLPSMPWRVTLTRYAPRMLDPGNLPSSMKGVQDGLCDAFATDDRWGLHEWKYDQVKRPKREGEPGVAVFIQSMEQKQ